MTVRGQLAGTMKRPDRFSSRRDGEAVAESGDLDTGGPPQRRSSPTANGRAEFRLKSLQRIVCAGTLFNSSEPLQGARAHGIAVLGRPRVRWLRVYSWLPPHPRTFGRRRENSDDSRSAMISTPAQNEA
jgi:hypothetical protein